MPRKSSGDPSSQSSFKTVGVSNATQFSSPSGAPSKQTKLRRKGAAGGTGFKAAATAAHRTRIQERMGARLHPTAVLYEQNAAAASEVQRNTRIVPSVAGQSANFWAKRAGG